MRLPSTPPQGGPVQPSGRVLPAAGRQAWLGPAPGTEQVVLTELRVRDLALVASARVRFGPGLNLLTGETGSGKSLIVDALGLSLGARAALDQVRHGARRALVEAAFDLKGDGSSAEVLGDLGHESGSSLILTR